MSTINRDFFLHQVRSTLFDGKLKANQIAGLDNILDYWDSNLSKKDDRWLAYALGTTHHETDRTMQPIREYGSNEYKRKKYDVTGNDPVRAKRYGNTQPHDGIRYAGRGYVQLTWKNNYQRAGKEIGRDLVTHPDDAMIPSVAVAVMFGGMTKGWFTGRRFSDYFNTSTSNWRDARRIINGVDKADLIKGYAMKYYAAISYTI